MSHPYRPAPGQGPSAPYHNHMNNSTNNSLNNPPGEVPPSTVLGTKIELPPGLPPEVADAAATALTILSTTLPHKYLLVASALRGLVALTKSFPGLKLTTLSVLTRVIANPAAFRSHVRRFAVRSLPALSAADSSLRTEVIDLTTTLLTKSSEPSRYVRKAAATAMSRLARADPTLQPSVLPLFIDDYRTAIAGLPLPASSGSSPRTSGFLSPHTITLMPSEWIKKDWKPSVAPRGSSSTNNANSESVTVVSGLILALARVAQSNAALRTALIPEIVAAISLPLKLLRIRWVAMRALGTMTCPVGEVPPDPQLEATTVSIAEAILASSLTKEVHLSRAEPTVYLMHYGAVQALGMVLRSDPDKWFASLGPRLSQILGDPRYAPMVHSSVLLTLGKLAAVTHPKHSGFPVIRSLLLDCVKSTSAELAEPALYALVNMCSVDPSLRTTTGALLQDKMSSASSSDPSQFLASDVVEMKLTLFFRAWCRFLAGSYSPIIVHLINVKHIFPSTATIPVPMDELLVTAGQKSPGDLKNCSQNFQAWLTLATSRSRKPGTAAGYSLGATAASALSSFPPTSGTFYKELEASTQAYVNSDDSTNWNMSVGGAESWVGLQPVEDHTAAKAALSTVSHVNSTVAQMARTGEGPSASDIAVQVASDTGEWAQYLTRWSPELIALVKDGVSRPDRFADQAWCHQLADSIERETANPSKPDPTMMQMNESAAGNVMFLVDAPVAVREIVALFLQDPKVLRQPEVTSGIQIGLPLAFACVPYDPSQPSMSTAPALPHQPTIVDTVSPGMQPATRSLSSTPGTSNTDPRSTTTTTAAYVDLTKPSQPTSIRRTIRPISPPETPGPTRLTGSSRVIGAHPPDSPPSAKKQRTTNPADPPASLKPTRPEPSVARILAYDQKLQDKIVALAKDMGGSIPNLSLLASSLTHDERIRLRFGKNSKQPMTDAERRRFGVSDVIANSVGQHGIILAVEELGGGLWSLKRLPSGAIASLTLKKVPRSSITCRFWAKGWCAKGSLCPFSHNVKKPVKCRYYFSATGCRNPNCGYSHDDTPIEMAEPPPPFNLSRPSPYADAAPGSTAPVGTMAMQSTFGVGASAASSAPQQPAAEQAKQSSMKQGPSTNLNELKARLESIVGGQTISVTELFLQYSSRYGQKIRDECSTLMGETGKPLKAILERWPGHFVISGDVTKKISCPSAAAKVAAAGPATDALSHNPHQTAPLTNFGSSIGSAGHQSGTATAYASQLQQRPGQAYPHGTTGASIASRQLPPPQAAPGQALAPQNVQTFRPPQRMEYPRDSYLAPHSYDWNQSVTVWNVDGDDDVAPPPSY